MSTPNDSQRLHTKIVKDLDSHQEYLSSNTEIKEFDSTSKDDTVEDIIIYNKILDHIQN